MDNAIDARYVLGTLEELYAGDSAFGIGSGVVSFVGMSVFIIVNVVEKEFVRSREVLWVLIITM